MLTLLTVNTQGRRCELLTFPSIIALLFTRCTAIDPTPHSEIHQAAFDTHAHARTYTHTYTHTHKHTAACKRQLVFHYRAGFSLGGQAQVSKALVCQMVGDFVID